MELASLAGQSIGSTQGAAGPSQYATRVTRKVLDLAADEGRMLAEMIDSSAGRGQNINVQA